MVELVWRKDDSIGIEFKNPEEYFETLGFLTKESRPIDIFTHENQRSGARGPQGKLRVKNFNVCMPAALDYSFRQSNDDRLSVSDYVNNLIIRHAFTKLKDPTGKKYTFHVYPESYDAVRATVPDEYLDDFDRGYNM